MSVILVDVCGVRGAQEEVVVILPEEAKGEGFISSLFSIEID